MSGAFRPPPPPRPTSEQALLTLLRAARSYGQAVDSVVNMPLDQPVTGASDVEKMLACAVSALVQAAKDYAEATR